MDRFFCGTVVKELGVLEKTSWGIAGSTKSALLVRKRGQLKLVLKQSMWALLGFGVSYFDLDMASAARLREMITDAERLSAEEMSV
jgi:hypothetical protein